MDKQLFDKVSNWFDDKKDEITEDIMRLVRIESVSKPGTEDAPFGEGCLHALEEMLAIGREHGFYTDNYGNRVGSIGNRDKNWDNLIGFWNHMDVVPEGNGWENDPFEPIVKEHYLIGRGARDNKGPAVGMLYMMQCLRELGIPLKHELCLFVGTDEERGMEDVEYYTAHYPAPRLSMTADSGFPVCYGEKGIIEGRMVANDCISPQILEVCGGSACNMIPDSAEALLKDSSEMMKEIERLLSVNDREGRISFKKEKEGIRVSARGTSRHSAFPEGSINAIHELSAFLMNIICLPRKDREIFAGMEKLSREYDGSQAGVAWEDDVSGKTTCAATVLTMEEGRLCLTLNIRYAISANSEENLCNLEICGIANNMKWHLERHSKPNYFPKEHPAVETLTRVYNELAGQEAQSFVMGGGTYARKLPNAFAYGIGGMEEDDADRRAKLKLFKPGHGGAHEPDEALNLRQFLKAMKIYTMAVVELNEVDIGES